MGQLYLFQEIPPRQLKEFMKKMKDGFPKSIHAHGFLRTMINWKEKAPELDIFILAPNGNPRLGVVFFFLLQNAFIGSVYAHDEAGVDSLQVALHDSKILPYMEKKITQFTCLNDLALKSFNTLSFSHWWRLGKETRNSHKTLWLPWNKAKEIEVH